MTLQRDQLMRLLRWFDEDTHRLEGDGVEARVRYFRAELFPAMARACQKYGVTAPDWLQPPSRMAKALIFIRG